MSDQPSANPNVSERTPRPPVDLQEVGGNLMEEARKHDAGRSALTLTPSEGGPLKQTLLALCAGQELTEHPSPGPAAIQVLSGAGRLRLGDEEVRLTAGTWAPIPLEKHGLHADEDLLALLTVVPNP
ncbi:cupin domain-containing protein [Egicoccus sp. AB-alg2]|uniref:cupin domain-containing protein n=1 Tax=Egicoccus sp. AB-alg2 TaxID=3242693 RepID=UPI00359EF732